MSRWLMAAAVVLVLVGEAQAEVFSGNEFLKWCTNTPEGTELACFGFLHATAEMIKLVREIGTDAAFPCLPDNATVGQYRDIVVRWLNEHPELRHEQALAAVIISLQEAFPCE